MKSNINLIYFIFLFAGTQSLMFGAPSEDYDNSLYVFTYIFFWAILIDISLVIIIHYKQSSYYLANHSFINLCIIIGMAINNLLFLRKLPDWN
jgi:hypothetical protein